MEGPNDEGFIYLYEDQLKIAGQTDLDGNLQKAFFYATGSHSADYMIDTGTTYRIFKNHLGSPRLVVKVSDGTIKQQIDYNVLGRVTKDTNSCFVPFGFAGGLRDRHTSLVRFGARDYDTETGRWTTKDPIRFEGGDTNLYAYVGNDPVNFVDPSGLSERDIERIRNAFNLSVARMNGEGKRRPGSGYINGILNNFNVLQGQLGLKDVGQQIGCRGQAIETQSDLKYGIGFSEATDDIWSYEVQMENLGLHFSVKAISSNPADPIIRMDPWTNSFTTSK